MKIAKAIVLALLLFGFCTGCESFRLQKDYSKCPDVKTPSGPLVTYIGDRIFDLMDWWPLPFGMRVQGGPGLLINVRATKFAQVGLGFAEGEKLGFKGREIGYWYEKRDELGISVAYVSNVTRDIIIGNRFLFEGQRRLEEQVRNLEAEGIEDLDIFKDEDRDRWDIGFTVHLLFIGFDWDLLRLREFADFWGGIITVDISNDDLKSRLRQAEATSAQRATSRKAIISPENVPAPPHLPLAGEGKY
ncbi:MAG: hypothetical protein ABIH42_04295 [Planctomycetota bacterium]